MGKPLNIDFVNDSVLRRLLERDIGELGNCFDSGFCKAVMILAGSIVEAVVVDYYLAFPPTGVSKKQIVRRSLDQLLTMAENDGLISSSTVEVAAVVRTYRNLIHPGREVRSRERIDGHRAAVAYHLVGIVIDEIRREYLTRSGFLAESAIEKVRTDPSAPAVFDHVIDQMSAIERVKLFRLIPDVSTSQELPREVLTNLLHLHRVVSRRVPEDILSEGARALADSLYTKSRSQVVRYLQFFGGFIDRLNETSRSAVVVYLLSLLSEVDVDLLTEIRSVDLYSFGAHIREGAQGTALKRATLAWFNLAEVLDDWEFLRTLEALFVNLDATLAATIRSEIERKGGVAAQRWLAAIDDFVPF